MSMMDAAVSRRTFALGMGWAAGGAALGLLGGAGALFSNGIGSASADSASTGLDEESAGEEGLLPLPPAAPDPQSMFGVDLNINMQTIDDYLDRPDVVYRDMRMIFDPARWEDIGEDPYSSTVLRGFRMVPFPYLATMAPIPVEGYYEGETLFDCEWSEDGELLKVRANYKESMTLLKELFPKKTPIFLCCGGAGYASFTKQLLLYLGWDPALVYNVGGMWDYQGSEAIKLIEYGRTDADDLYALWRADYTVIDFTLLRPESVLYQDKRK